MSPDQDILVVEDDPATRHALSLLLEGQGYHVAAAEDGRAALAYLDAGKPPALILLDLMMPGMDGWRFRHEQTRRRQLASIPVIILSAADSVEQHARSLGAAGCLQKPLDFDALLSMVRRVGQGRGSTNGRGARPSASLTH
jgi:CheY-like chemotaxis protein